MISCMWASVHLDKERYQFHGVLRNMDVEVTQQIFSTTQNEIHSLEERALFRLQGQIDWDQSPWRCCTLVHDNTYKQLNANSVCLRGFSVVSGRQMPRISTICTSEGVRKNWVFSLISRISRIGQRRW